MRVLITRHIQAAKKLKEILEPEGFDVQIEPLLEIHFDVKPVSLEDVQAVIVTSQSGANALARGTEIRHLPAYAVGKATAAVLEDEGFQDVRCADGNVEALDEPISTELSPDAGPLVHISGKHIAGNLEESLSAKGFSVRRDILYRAETPAKFSNAAIKSFQEQKIDAVLFFSPRTAATFATLLKNAKLEHELSSICAICLSDAVAEPVKALTWKQIEISEKPDQTALLDILRKARDQAKKEIVTEAEKTEKPEESKPSTMPSSKDEAAETNSNAAGTTVIVKSGASWRLVTVLVVLLGLAGSYIFWPLWGPALPDWMRTVLTVVMDAGRKADVAERVDALSKRIVVVEKELTAVKTALAKKSQGVSPTAFNATTNEIKKIDAGQRVLSSEVKSLSGRLNDFDKKIAALTSVPVSPDSAKAIAALRENSSGKLASLEKENTALHALVQNLGVRITALETRPALIAEGPGKSNALLLAIGQLRDAARTASGFASPFAAVEALVADNTAHKANLTILKNHAAKGAPDLPVLQRRFDRLSGDIVRASYTPAGDSWVDKTIFKISSLVTFRRVGETGAKRDDVAGHVARVELRLAAGDLKAAVGIVKGLKGDPARVAKKWLADAEARIAVDSAISNLFQSALQGAGASGVSGG
tara:strand:- start:20871 stop:22817 length:1947 start_codon:yes stop_codon:yes gene_type:complete